MSLTLEQQIRGAVARGWTHEVNANKEMDVALAEAITQELITALTSPREAKPKLTGEKHTCMRRLETPGPWPAAKLADDWRLEANGDRCCTFCGSMHPEDFLKFLCNVPTHEGYRVERSDKAYKYYVHRPDVQNASQGAIKFYTHHLGSEEMTAKINEAWPAADLLSRQRFQGILNDIVKGRP